MTNGLKSALGIVPIIAGFILLAANWSPSPAQAPNLQEARAGHKTVLTQQLRYSNPAPTPPSELLKLVKYPSPAGNLAAYVTPDPGDGKKRPAILWLTGGFGNGIGSTAWKKANPANDQSASVFREFGIVMMYPSLRGGSGNPGQAESFYGEVDDVLAAARYLAAQPYVDPKRIYLGGHSTGGTLALLVAESTDLFRAVFSFGPVAEAADYGAKSLTFDVGNAQENRLRSPLYYLGAIRSTTFILEGSDKPSNLDSIRQFKQRKPPPVITFVEVPNTSHFSVLAPMNRLLAQKITKDTGVEPNIKIIDAEASDAVNNTPAR
jgi:acetyl esterase/lipase